MTILFDTNIFTRAAQPGHAQQPPAVRAGDILKSRRDVLCVVPQVPYESWRLLRARLGKMAWASLRSKPMRNCSGSNGFLQSLPETPTVLTLWEELVRTHDVKGKRTHDAHTVAAMKAHNISHILTYNAGDFSRYTGISVITPDEVVRSAHKAHE
jgi:predicted nucleic acid-binding protein